MAIEVINGLPIATDQLPTLSTIIVAGLSENLMLEQELIQRGFNVLGIDSNPDRILEAGVLKTCIPVFNRHFSLISRPLTPAYEQEKQVYTDADGKQISTMRNHVGVDANRFTITPTVALSSVLMKFGNISLIILNLHGEEYKLTKSINPHCQLCVRFYQQALGYTHEHTQRLIDGITKRGYTVASIAPVDQSGCVDVLLVPANH